MPNRPVVALDISVLQWPAGLDVLDRNPMFLCPFSQRFTDVFGPVARREEGLLVGYGHLRSP